METNRQYEYVIGIDLGHGETSAAICPLQWDNAPGELDAVKDLEMGGNKKVIPSAITILDDGRAYIGDAAFSPEVLKQANVRVCFKQAPKNINGDAEQIMIRYMQEVYRRIRENNSALLTNTNHLVYIATPSGWDVSTQNLYVEMARKAGIPMGGVTKESRAAFVKAQQDTTSGISRNIEKGAVVFDMGSSTLDFTYMNSSLSNLIDYGYDCGASFVEKSIFSEQEKEEEAIQLFEKKYPKLVDCLVFEARKVKEQVYFDPSLRVKKTINFSDIIDDEELEDERFKLMFRPGELNEFLEKNGYIEKIENAMLDYKKKYIPNQQIYGVFLTGGASRMDFIKPLVCKCWGVPEELVYRDQDPSLTISQGVAEVARMDMRTAGMDNGLEDEIEQLIESDVVINAFTDKITLIIASNIRDGIADILNNFKDNPYSNNYDLILDSIADLNEGLNTIIQTFAKVDGEMIENCANECIEEVTANIRKQVNDIVSVYRAQGNNMNIDLPKLNCSTINIPSINLDGLIDDIVRSLAPDGNKNTATAWGAGVGMVLFGPLGAAAGGWLARNIFGKSKEEQMNEFMIESLTDEQRTVVYNQFAENWDNIQDDIYNSVNSAILQEVNIATMLNSNIKSLLQSYKENLKNARILID